MMPTLQIIVPVLNEEDNVQQLFRSFAQVRDRLRSSFYCRFIVVDDGSTDATVKSAEDLRGNLDVTILSHERNMGPGAAFGTAFHHLAGRLADNDYVITMEGDNTSDVECLVHMLTRREEGYEVVLASPYAYGGGIIGVDLNRVWLSHFANALAKTVLGLRGLHTLSSFFRLYSAPVISRLQSRYGPRIIQFTGFECMVELLLKLVLIEAKISEVEMNLDWSGRRGKSKMKRLKAIGGYLRLLVTGLKWRRQAGAEYWYPIRASRRDGL
jgi:dolichol-phosphate mannosyltransferase